SMAIEFNSSVNRYQAVSGYAQTAKTSASPDQESAKKAAEAGAAQGKPEQAPDSVELSDDAKSVNKMSKEERAALVKSLKDDLDNQMNRFINMMTQTFQKQGMTVKSAQDDSFWQMFASGNLTVDLETKQAAQEAISEDGYWGVKQTSERIFKMAQALAGDDPEKMKEMQEAVKKGYEAAGKSWGGDLPEIAGQTLDAVNGMFDAYFNGGKTEE
ncbi:MAG: hypothetical protein K2P33_10840, partial [Acutalibacter sp.]|nr:hypothetical protein [Acutalibacter sp.]